MWWFLFMKRSNYVWTTIIISYILDPYALKLCVQHYHTFRTNKSPQCFGANDFLRFFSGDGWRNLPQWKSWMYFIGGMKTFSSFQAALAPCLVVLMDENRCLPYVWIESSSMELLCIRKRLLRMAGQVSSEGIVSQKEIKLLVNDAWNALIKVGDSSTWVYCIHWRCGLEIIFKHKLQWNNWLKRKTHKGPICMDYIL